MEVVNFDQLRFRHDYAFCAVLMENEDICIQLTEMITGRKIHEIVKMEGQKSIRKTLDGKGVRFDVYFEDDKNTLYDIEMQTTNTGNLFRRARYYHTIAGLDSLEKGKDYNSLKNSYVIFICTFDPLGEGKYLYTIENHIKEFPEKVYNDGMKTIFVSSDYIIDDVPDELKAFLIYLKNDISSTKLTDKIDIALEKIKTNEGRREEYMTLLEHYEYFRAEGRAEGRVEGIAEGRAEGRAEGKADERKRTICTLAKKMPPEEIAEIMEIPLKEIKDVLYENSII